MFPDRLFDAIWSWFDARGWPIRDKLYADAAIDKLEQAGTDRAVALPYAHKPGMASELNAWVGKLAKRRPMLVAGATVHPLDTDAISILRAARDEHGARVVKQHCHVMNIAPDDPRMFPLYEACITLGLPLVLHCGNGPKPDDLQLTSDLVSGADRTERVLQRYPDLTLVVAHLGAMQEARFFELLDRYPNLYLDTTMALTPFMPGQVVADRSQLKRWPDRILFGSDFPYLPFELERERNAVKALDMTDEQRASILHGAAARLFKLEA